MTQRMTLLIAGAITAFMLVLIGGVAVTVASKPAAASQTEVQGQVQSASTVSVPTAGAQPAPATQTATLSPDVAAQVALNVVQGAALTRTPELVDYQGTLAYEVLLDQGTVYVNANTGGILYNGAAQIISAPAQNGLSGGYEREHEGREHEGGYEGEYDD